MGVDLMVLLEANKALLAEADEKLAAISERERRFRALLDDCAAERQKIGREKDALLLTDQLYRRRFQPAQSQEDEDVLLSDASQQGGATDRRPKARIGAQRYRILAQMRIWNRPATIEELADATSLTTKRIRDQIRADLPEGIIGELDGRFALRAIGWDLLERFEAYKRSKGEPLPSLEGPFGDDEAEDDAAATDSEGLGQVSE